MIGVALGVRPHLPFVLAANRDEAFSRPTREAHWWDDAPDVLAGRDLLAGGTWLGISRSGKLAAVTNIHRPAAAAGESSRGALVADFLQTPMSAADYEARVLGERHLYNPFNLLLHAAGEARYLNRDGQSFTLEDGIHAMSNTPIGDDWPKTRLMRTGLDAALREDSPTDALLDLLATGSASDDPADPQDSLFIRGASFGTRSSTVILVSSEGVVDFTERQFDSSGNVEHEVSYRVTLAL